MVKPSPHSWSSTRSSTALSALVVLGGGRSSRRTALLLLLLFLTILINPMAVVRADFGDTVDPDYSCPARTTCPTICVETVDECPTKCRDESLRLCRDGHCAADCENDADDGFHNHNSRNPCPPCAPVACARVDDSYERCLAGYGSFYANEAACRAETAKQGTAVRAGPVSAFLLWVAAVTALTFLWSASNHRRAPASTKPLNVADVAGSVAGQTVTGYRRTALGRLLFVAVLATLLAFHLLILKYAIASYRENQTEALRAFEVVWCIGFVWTFLFKWPYSVQSVFLRRCALGDADTVCIFTPRVPRPAAIGSKNSSGKNRRDPAHIAGLRRVAHAAAAGVNRAMSLLFSMPAAGNGRMRYLPIATNNNERPMTEQAVDNANDSNNNNKYFYFDFRRYNYDRASDTFQPGLVCAVGALGDALGAPEAGGLTDAQVRHRLQTVGPNRIEMKQPVAWQCLADEFCKPFYSYQAYMLWTWIPLNYYYLAIVHGSCILVGALAVAFFRFRNERNLYKLTHCTGDIECLRNGGQFVTVPQEELVPGDVVTVAPGPVYCDMVLVRSEGLLLDESALTGESTPTAKTAVDAVDRGVAYNPVQHKKHTVTAGTTVLESEVENNLAVVLSTGSFTNKGNLLRDIMSYERASFAFDAEVPFVVVLLFLESVVGFALVAHFLREQAVYAWFYGMYVVSTLLPPLLPTVFTVSVGISDNRLSRKRIACSNSEDILVAGKVTKAFFDKTGTLTRQGLDFISSRCMQTWNDGNHGNTTTQLSDDLVLGMACCHGLTRSQEGGNLIGNPVDRTMFGASGARMLSPTQIQDRNGTTVDVLKHFDFDHHRMTQSVIVQRPDGTRVTFVKGSGENIGRLCREDSLPSDYSAAIRESAKSGTYQIAMAMKVLPADTTDVQNITRDQVECDLAFVGCINFKNILRDETPDVIRQLEAGDVQCFMVTGDSVLTGIRIAKECSMIKEGLTVLLCSHINSDGSFSWVDESNDQPTDLPTVEQLRAGSIELAVSGEVWEALLTNDPEKAADLAPSIRVYGRCTPFHKVSVVSTWVQTGFVTMMCGDGGNDVGGLKTAHVGVALSDAEASIVSPFTSLDKSLTSVVDILMEGRCALASALASYKYVIIYGQIEAMNNVIMAYFRINFTEYAWAFMDGFWVIGMSFTLPLAKAADKLAPARPTASLLGVHTLSSVLGILFFNALFAVLAIANLFQQDWFQCRKWSNSDVSNLAVIGDNYESTTLFLVSGYQYISTAMSYNFGYEFRQSWVKNVWFWSLAAFFSFMIFWAMMVPGKLSCFWRVNCENEDVMYSAAMGQTLPIQNPWNTTIMPVDYRITLLLIILLNTAANIGWDYFVVNGLRKMMVARKRNKVELIPAKAGIGSELELAETV